MHNYPIDEELNEIIKKIKINIRNKKEEIEILEKKIECYCLEIKEIEKDKLVLDTKIFEISSIIQTLQYKIITIKNNNKRKLQNSFYNNFLYYGSSLSLFVSSVSSKIKIATKILSITLLYSNFNKRNEIKTSMQIEEFINLKSEACKQQQFLIFEMQKKKSEMIKLNVIKQECLSLINNSERQLSNIIDSIYTNDVVCKMNGNQLVKKAINSKV